MCQDIVPPTPCSTIPVQVSLPSGVAPYGHRRRCHRLRHRHRREALRLGRQRIGLSLGDGSTAGPDTCVNGNPCSTTPVQVSLPSGVTPTAIGAGSADGYAIGSDGNLYAWGDDSVGELGDGTTTGSSTPVVVSFPPGSTPKVLSTEPDSQSAYAMGTSLSVVTPSNGATLSGSTYLDASASNATSVEFLLLGGTYGFSARVICTAKSARSRMVVHMEYEDRSRRFLRPGGGGVQLDRKHLQFGSQCDGRQPATDHQRCYSLERGDAVRIDLPRRLRIERHQRRVPALGRYLRLSGPGHLHGQVGAARMVVHMEYEDRSRRFLRPGI